MKSSLKTALSLLITVVVFAVCLAFSLAGGFKLIEVNFYEPRIVQNVQNSLSVISSEFDEYVNSLNSDFATFVEDDSTASFIERTASESDIKKRLDLVGKLMDDHPGLEGIRLVESNGVALHYSTYGSDVKNETDELITYSNYTDLKEIPFFNISNAGFSGDLSGKKVTGLDKCLVLYFDSAKDRLIFSYPFYDQYTANRGTLIFYVSSDDFLRVLIQKGKVSLNTRCVITGAESAEANVQNARNVGFVFNMPYSSRTFVKEQTLAKWNRSLFGLEQLFTDDKDSVYVLVTDTAGKYANMGWVCEESDFVFSPAERFVILLVVFITLFLIVFLLFNLEQDDMVVIRSHVHKFHMALLTEYIERHENADWQTITRELKVQKAEVDEEIKKTLKWRGRKYSKELDELLDETWNDFFGAVGAPYVKKQKVVEAKGNSSAEIEAVEDSVKEVKTPEVLEEVLDAEVVEDLEEIPDAEPVDDLEEIPEAEAVEELEELSDVEEVEELEEVDEVEEIKAVEKNTPMPSKEIPLIKEFEVEDVPVKKDEDFADSFMVEIPTFDDLDENSEREKK